jgi:hypothetical protein
VQATDGDDADLVLALDGGVGDGEQGDVQAGERGTEPLLGEDVLWVGGDVPKQLLLRLRSRITFLRWLKV